MDAGKLDKRVTLKHMTLTQGGTGEMTKTEAEYATVWAQLLEQRLSEVFASGADQAAQTRVFRVRRRADVLETDVVTYKGVDHEVTAIREFERSHLDLITNRTGNSA